MDNNSTEKAKNEAKYFNSKKLILYFLFIIGIIILISLYINFKTTYQVNDLIQQVTISEPKDRIENKEESSPTNQSLETTSSNIEKTSNMNCLSLVHFNQEYFKMQLKANRGNDFKDEALALKKYKINNKIILDNLSKLTILSSLNTENKALYIEFKSIIKDIYGQSYSNNWYKNLNKIFFIRPIATRALETEGINKEIAQIESSLSKGNLIDANIHLKSLLESVQLNDLEDIKNKINNKIAIEQAFENLDKYLLDNQVDCSIVSE